MDYILDVVFMFLVGIVIMAVILTSGQAAEEKRNWALENMTGYTKKIFQMTNEPDTAVMWSVKQGDYSSSSNIKYIYKISINGIGIKNTGDKPASVLPVLLFKGEVKELEENGNPHILTLGPNEQDNWELDFSLESGGPPLIKATDTKSAGVIADEKNYDIDTNENEKLARNYYGVMLKGEAGTSAQGTTRYFMPAILDGQNLFINDFMIKADPFALLVKNIPLTKCDVPVTIKCKNEMQILLFKDYNRKYSVTDNPCDTDPNSGNVCEQSLDMCGGKVKVTLLRTNTNCNAVNNIHIETTSRATDEDRKKYKLGETAVISFWKAGSKCWENPLQVQPGCEDEFYGAFTVLIPADKYDKG